MLHDFVSVITRHRLSVPGAIIALEDAAALNRVRCRPVAGWRAPCPCPPLRHRARGFAVGVRSRASARIVAHRLA
jgi:hypothetical protein